MLDREQEVVMLVKQRQTFSACLFRDTEYGRLDLDFEEIVEETNPLCVPSEYAEAMIRIFEVESIPRNGN